MTLILSFASANKVIQVSDRRLTRPDGTLYTDDANKAICVGCANSYFAVGYTGLGTISKEKRTDEWLVDYLASINAGQMTLSSIIENIKAYSSQTLKVLNIPRKYRALTLVLAGYAATPFIAQVSNIENESMERLSQVDDVFHVSLISVKPESNPKTAFALTAHGMEDALTKPLSQRLLKQRRRLIAKEAELAAENLVSTIRASTYTPTYGDYVGRNCMAVVVNPRNSETSFQSYYFPDKEAPQSYAPHVIFSGIAFKGIETWAGENPPPWWKT
jgi:hypothetical protein